MGLVFGIVRNGRRQYLLRCDSNEVDAIDLRLVMSILIEEIEIARI